MKSSKNTSRTLHHNKQYGVKHEGWQCYMVECSDGTLYTGCAVNVTRRVAKHNKGDGAKYTRSRLPVKLVWTSPILPDRSTAQKIEASVKGMPRHLKEEIIRAQKLNTRSQNA